MVKTMSQTVAETIEAVQQEMCDKYCKYPELYKGKEPDSISDEVCVSCPLFRL